MRHATAFAIAVAWVAAAGATARAGQSSAAAPTATLHPALAGAQNDATCASCHTDITTRKVLHGPVAAGTCLACHVQSQAGGRVAIGLANGATSENTAPLCVTCHEDMPPRLTQAHVHAPVAAGGCTVCHDPHGSAFPFQLRAQRNEACLTCHEDVAEALRQKVPHAPAAASCVLCHEPHASRFPAQTRQALNTLCLSCHAQASPAPDDETPAEQQAWERALAAAGLSGSRRRIGLNTAGDAGHPVSGHPVQGVRDPLEKGRELTCVSCHNPHGAAGGALFRFGAINVSGLCIKCHNL